MNRFEDRWVQPGGIAVLALAGIILTLSACDQSMGRAAAGPSGGASGQTGATPPMAETVFVNPTEVEVGKSSAFELLTHCGISTLLLGDKVYTSPGGPFDSKPGYGDPMQAGVLKRIDDTHVIFTPDTSGESLTFTVGGPSPSPCL